MVGKEIAHSKITHIKVRGKGFILMKTHKIECSILLEM